jgi:hypothetical protein
MSTKGDNIITVKNELSTKAGDYIHTPLFAKLRGNPLDQTGNLVGNEIAIGNYSCGFRTNMVQQAVTIPVSEEIKTELDLRSIAGAGLKRYAAERLKVDLQTAFFSVPVGTGTNVEDTTVAYGAANATQLNAYCVANSDRLLFSGGSNTNTMSTSIATVAADTGVLSAKTLCAAKDMAEQTTNSSLFAITPYMTKSGQEWFVLFVDPKGFRQLQADAEIRAATKDARPREKDFEDNPLFNGGDLLFDGIIIKKARDYTSVSASGGASGVAVGQAQLCGINSVLMGYSMKTKPTRLNEDKYQTVYGVGFQEYRGQTKVSVNGTQTGMVSIFHSEASV